MLTKENATRETQTFNDYHSEQEYRKKEKKRKKRIKYFNKEIYFLQPTIFRHPTTHYLFVIYERKSHIR